LIEFLDRIVPSPPDRPEIGGPDHPMRKVTQQVAFDPAGWTKERAGKVAQLFDAMASGWSERTSTERQEPLRDALERGGLDGLGEGALGTCLEIGSGTGSSTGDLTARFERVVCVDLSREMLRHATPTTGLPVNADAARLPVRNEGAACVVLVNALLFPAEIDRALSANGALVWVNSLGDRTPIHLSASDVERALPGAWRGRASEAGWGTWCVLRRAP